MERCVEENSETQGQRLKMKVLKIHSLEKGWCDKDRVLLHASFQILVDYVEKEEALSGHIDWNWDEEHKRTAKEIRSLY